MDNLTDEQIIRAVLQRARNYPGGCAGMWAIDEKAQLCLDYYADGRTLTEGSMRLILEDG